MAESRTMVDAAGVESIVAMWRLHVAPGDVAATHASPLEFRSNSSRCFLPVRDYPPNWSAPDDARLARLLERARVLGERGIVPAIFHFSDGRCQEHELPDPAPWEPGAIPRTARFVTDWFERRGETSVGTIARYDETHQKRH